MLNNLLFILGIIALSNGNISLGDNIIESDLESPNINGKSRGMSNNNKIKLKGRIRPKKSKAATQDYEEDINIEPEIEEVENVEEISNEGMKFNLNDISKGLKMLELTDDD